MIISRTDDRGVDIEAVYAVYGKLGVLAIEGDVCY